MELKKQIEAILFTLGKFVSIEELAKHINTNPEEVLKALNGLKKEYEAKDSSLTIHQQDNLFKLNVKKEFGFLTNKLLQEKDLDSPTTKTLAIIAYKAPVNQSDVIKIRGNKAYEHIVQLRGSGLISSERYGRTRLLKLTQHFYDYFDISEKEVRQELSRVIPSNIKSILDELPKPEK